MTCALRRLKPATHSRTHAPPRYSRVVLCVRRPLPGCAPRFHKTTTQTSNPSHGLTLTLPLPLADAYAGQNTKIRDTLNNLILKVCFSHTRDSSSQFHQCALAHLPVLVLCAVAPELADVGRPPLLPDRGHGAPSSAHWNPIPALGPAHTCSPLRLVARRSSSGTRSSSTSA